MFSYSQKRFIDVIQSSSSSEIITETTTHQLASEVSACLKDKCFCKGECYGSVGTVSDTTPIFEDERVFVSEKTHRGLSSLRVFSEAVL